MWNASWKVPSSEAHPGYLEDRPSERYPGLKTCAGLQSNEERVRFTGRCSVLDWSEGVVYALKVRNDWNKFSPPVNRHLGQLHIYMKGLGVDRRKLVYVSKNDLGDIREWPEAVPDELAVTFDAGRYERVVESQARL